jgi:hypothetical protein
MAGAFSGRDVSAALAFSGSARAAMSEVAHNNDASVSHVSCAARWLKMRAK